MISVVVIIYNMKREVERTFYSLSKLYQKEAKNGYEIIVVDNGSDERLSDDFILSFGDNFKYYYLENASASPASAVNFGASKVTGDIIGIVIDGARIISDAVIRKTENVFEKWNNPIVAVLGYHLGPDLQSKSIQNGYCQNVEDKILEEIDWKNNPNKLFEVSVLAGSNPEGLDGSIAESNCMFIKKSTFEKIGGMDARFNSPGGGLVNLDFFKRLLELNDVQLVLLRDEGSFHQIHGGTMSNVSGEEKSIENFIKYSEEYKKITGKDYEVPIIKKIIY